MKEKSSFVYCLSAQKVRKNLLLSKQHNYFFQFNKTYKLLLESQKFNHKESFIEKAKLLWARVNQVRTARLHDQFLNVVSCQASLHQISFILLFANLKTLRSCTD